MNGYSFDQRMKTNAVTKQLNEEIDWVQVKGDQLKDAAYEFKKVTSPLMTIELLKEIIEKLQYEHMKWMKNNHPGFPGLKNDEQDIDYS